MRRNKRWKTILEYEIGILLLIAAVLAAWFLPDLYTQLRDLEQFQHPVLSKRDAIQFLDMDSLDIAGRIKLLKEVSVFDDWSYEPSNDLLMKTYLKKAQRLLEKWVEYEVLPEETETLIKELGEEAELEAVELSNGQTESAMYRLIVGQSVFHICCIWVADPDETESLFLLMDADKDLLYYVAVFGQPFWDEMAQRVGPDSYDTYSDLMDAYYAGKFDMNSYFGADKWQNLAKVASASSCKQKQEEEDKEAEEKYTDPRSYREFVLQYDNFEGCAEIAMLYNYRFGYGMDVSLGTNAWRRLIMDSTGEDNAEPSFIGWFDDPYGVEMPYNEKT